MSDFLKIRYLPHLASKNNFNYFYEQILASRLKLIWQSFFDTILAIFTFSFSIFSIKKGIINTLLRKQKYILLKSIMIDHKIVGKWMGC